ncbi:MAG: FAD-binding protein [Lachnospiraceae bacterium]|nr:FAD-binding protein [Lachnospiraceae bacterium]
MLRIANIKTSVEESTDILLTKACRMLKMSREDITDFSIVRRSLDARKKPALTYVYTVELETRRDVPKAVFSKHKDITLTNKKEYELPMPGSRKMAHRPVVIGSGPAGLFAAFLLAQRGFCPIILEKGDKAEIRTEKVAAFWDGGKLDIASNVQFGEGGAGTFSDGKLNTGVKDPIGRKEYVLRTFVDFGAPEEILYDQKPHLGTDILTGILVRMRAMIEGMGGEYHFLEEVTDFQVTDGALTGLEINHGDVMPVSCAILAIGHSARDTYHRLLEKQVAMQEKAFAVGVRIEHPQTMIDVSQYGRERGNILPSAAYKLTHQTTEGRGVYSFCMCPGGHVVNASSEEGRLCINGMSYQARNSDNANSALIVTVNPEDYRPYENEVDNGVLAGLAFQRELERRAFAENGGAIPSQLFTDFKNGTLSTAYGDVLPVHKGATAFGRVDALLPDFIQRALVEGIEAFGRRIRGFDRPDALISGIEARTSSPIRILRDDNGEANIKGLYPAGEGAGYAGGIMSAAMDGMRAAEKIIAAYAPTEN